MKLRIGTRSSKLALAQTQMILGQIKLLEPSWILELVPIVSEGDQKQTETLSGFGGAGVFVKALQDALLEKRIDLAVHSCKDLPAVTPDDLVIAAIPERADHRDALVFGSAGARRPLAEFKKGAKLGTSSPRRRYQVLAVSPGIEVVELRGNIDTRIRKVTEGHVDAIVLAEAGLKRLGLNPARLILDGPGHVPAAAQGALALECRRDEIVVRKLCSRLDHAPSQQAVSAERDLLRILKAGCHVPLGVRARYDAGHWCMEATLPARPGFPGFYLQIHQSSPEHLASLMAEHLRKDAGRELSKWLE